MRRSRIIVWAVVLFLIGALIFLAYWFDWGWTGFNEHVGPNVSQYQPTKTLWDWLNLLGVLAIPVVVGLGAAWYTAQQGKISERENTNNQHEAVIKAYIDKMSELLLEKALRESKPGDAVRIVARAQTLTTLYALDKDRKGRVLQFLSEAGLINGETDKVIIYLEKVSLDETNLNGIFLQRANLSRADMNNVKLHRAILTSTILELTNLEGADLSSADMIRANLSQADLSGANLNNALLIGANLSGANLTKANLEGADLRSAILQGATVTTEQLSTVKSLENATMPDGSKRT